ncbi:MAG: cobalamin biosynthesis central domain-containing protein [Faecalibacterium prausnitzii]
MSRAYLAFTAKGEALAHRLAEALPGSVSRCGGDVTLKGWTAEHFAQDEALIFVGAVGIAVRAIAPHCRSKAADPAVVVVDEGGNFAVPLLSGHLGGANALARALAGICGAVPVITTATDVNGLFAVDLWAKAQNCAVLEPERIKRVSGALLAGQTVRYWSPWPVAGSPRRSEKG